jgi:predicted HicB family RNase H-like nuclease
VTRPKSLRIPDDLWADALAAAKAEGKTLTEVVVAALERYVKTRG